MERPTANVIRKAKVRKASAHNIKEMVASSKPDRRCISIDAFVDEHHEGFSAEAARAGKE